MDFLFLWFSLVLVLLLYTGVSSVFSFVIDVRFIPFLAPVLLRRPCSPVPAAYRAFFCCIIEIYEEKL